VARHSRTNIGHEGDAGTEDKRQACGLNSDRIVLRDHPGIRDHGDVGQLVGGLECVDLTRSFP
jgi:hypothetical protein